MATLTLLLIIGRDLLIDMDNTENARTFPCHLLLQPATMKIVWESRLKNTKKTNNNILIITISYYTSVVTTNTCTYITKKYTK